jgi:RHS repeat-associated protein
MKALKIFGLFLFVLLNWEAKAQCTPPISYLVYGTSAEICNGSGSASVALNGSQLGVTYQLKRDGVSVLSPLSGTGTFQYFGWTNITTDGIYTVEAISGVGCSSMMNSSVQVKHVNRPEQIFNIGGGGFLCPGTTSTSISLSGSQVGYYYALKLYGNLVTELVGTGSPLVFTNISTLGVYAIEGRISAAPTSCIALMQGSAQVFSTPYLSANTEGCLEGGFTEINYEINDISGIVSHSWSVSAGGQIVADYGSGINVKWTQPGLNTVSFNFQTTNGCSGTLTSTQTIFSPPIISASITNNTRCVAPFNGAIDLTVSGLIGAATFNWYGGLPIPPTLEDQNALQEDSYMVEITDTQTGCSVTGAYVVEDNITEYPNVDVVIENNTRCAAPFNGSITLGNLSNESYSWTGPEGFSSSATSLTGLGSGGPYALKVTNLVSGCSLTSVDMFGQDITIDNSLEPIDAYVLSITDNEKCTAPFNGAIDIDVTGGTAYTYSWTGPNSFQSTSQDISGLKEGAYQVTVTETTTKCTDQETVNVALYNPGPGLSTFLAMDSGGGGAGVGYFCPGGQVTLDIQFESSPGPFNVVYSNGTSDFTLTNIVNYNRQFAVTPVGNTTYYVKSVYDVSTRCTTTFLPTDFSVSLISAKPIAYSVGGGGSYCSGGSGVSITLPNSQYGSYQLKRGSTLVGVPLDGADGTALSWDNITTAGTYTIVATQPDYNCTQTMTGSAVVTVISLPSSFTTSGTTTICSGETAATVSLSGSTSSISYQLLLGGVNSGSPKTGTGAGLSWTGLTSAGTYTVVATNPIANCTRTMSGSAVVTGNTTPANFTLTGGGTICSGATGPSFTLGGSETGVSYQLKVNGSTNSGSAVNGTGSPIVWTNKTVAGPYSVVATRAGCIAKTMPGTPSLVVNPLPTLYAVGGTGGFCTGGTGLPVTLSNSNIGVNYQLKRGTTLVGSPIAGNGTALSFPNQTTAGTYTIAATNSTTTCTSTMTGSAVVTVISLPSSFTTSGTTTICSGETAATVSLSGSTSSISYQLLLGGVNSGSPKTGTGAGLSWTGLTSAGTYTVVATNPIANCTRTMSGSAVVTGNTTPANFTLTGGGTICSGATGPSFTLGGSETGVSYQLKVNGSTNSGSAVNGTGSPIVWTNKTVAGPYSVVATRAGCIAKTMPGTPSLVVNPLPTLYAVGGTGGFCTGGTGLPVTLSNSNIGVNYQLKRGTTLVGSPIAGNGTALSFPNQTTAGTYTIAATNSTTTCTSTMTGSAVITVNALPTAYTVGGAGAVCAGSGRSITLSNSQAGVSYQLIMGGNNIGSPILGIPGALRWPNQGVAGTYTVRATNSTTGCIRIMTGSVVITINPLPNLFSVTGGNVCGAASIVIGLSGSESGANYKYQLKLNGVNQGTSKTGTGVSLSWGSLAGIGVYTIVATNTTTTCVQQMTGSATLYPKPAAFSITGGGVFCTGGAPIPVQLLGSETGVNYQLKLNGVDDGTPMAGNNSSLVWQRQTVGNYTIAAINTTSNCTQNMTGQATISEVTVLVPLVSGPASVSSGSTVTLSTPTLAGHTYHWKRDGDVLSSETAASLSVAQSGGYQVFVSASGCSATSDIHFVQMSVKPYYNGLITSMRWRTAKPYVVTGSDLQGMYSFDYDEKYQLKEAQFYNINPVLGTFSMAGNQLRESNLRYDPNGNIKTLQRFDATGSRTHNFAYAYNANATATTQLNNQLNSIPGYSSYSYNQIGQMTGEDKTTGDDQYVEYDVTGKVTKVFSDAGKTQTKVEYAYDDRGFRLYKKNYVTNRTTWYIRDASGNILSVFEEDNTNGAFNETEVPIYGSGKLGTYYPDPDQIGSTAYELTDHLGNVRAIVKEKHNVYTATVEDTNVEDISNPRVQEMQYFQNLFETEVTDFRLNHTPPMPGLVESPNKAAYLFWNDNAGTQATNKAIGPAIALKVDAGDQLTMETFARYEHQPNFTRNLDLALLSALLGNTFVGTLSMDNLPTISNMMQNGLSAGGFAGTGTDATRPYAYLNYMLFNESLQFVDGGAWRVSSAAAFLPGEEGDPTRLHEKLAFPGPITASQKGFVYVWVSNESKNAKVWFDDLKVTHVQGIVTQATDYYPYGSVARELKTPEDAVYRYGYQGQFAEHDDETNWDHFELREYDALTGRMTTTDPYGQYWSSYIGMGNNPINGVDPDGGLFGKWRAERWAAKHGGESYFDDVTKTWWAEAGIENGVHAKDFGHQGFGLNLKGKAEFAKDFAGGVKDFVTVYDEMRDANLINSDKYFHSKANYMATRRGEGGEYAAEKMSNLREIFDQRVKGDSRESSEQDQEANRYGRERAKHHRIHRTRYKFALPKYRKDYFPEKH